LDERVRDRNRALLASVALIPMTKGVFFLSIGSILDSDEDDSPAKGGGDVGAGDRLESGAAMLPNVTVSFLCLSSSGVAAM